MHLCQGGYQSPTSSWKVSTIIWFGCRKPLILNIVNKWKLFSLNQYHLFIRERLKRCKECLIVLPNKNQLILGKDQNFTFDYVFEESATQESVYIDTVKPLVQSCLDGYNATVFAYGQTGGLIFTFHTKVLVVEIISLFFWTLYP